MFPVKVFASNMCTCTLEHRMHSSLVIEKCTNGQHKMRAGRKSVVTTDTANWMGLAGHMAYRRTNSKRTPPQCFGKWTCVGFSFQVHYQLSSFKRLFSGCFEGIARTFGLWAEAWKKFIECLVPSKVDDWIYILVKWNATFLNQDSFYRPAANVASEMQCVGPQ